MNEIRFKRVRKVRPPERGHDLDAGIDFFVPDDFVSEVMAGVKFQAVVRPNSDLRIPSGIHIEIPEGWCMTFLNKSGISYNKKLIVGGQLIDAGYQGEVHFHLINVGQQIIAIEPGMKICQGIFLPVPKIKLIEEHGKLFSETSARGQGGFGSTN